MSCKGSPKVWGWERWRSSPGPAVIWGRYVTEPVLPGIAAVTYQTPDLAVARSAVARAGITVAGEDPGGFVVRGAEGELLEVTSTVWI